MSHTRIDEPPPIPYELRIGVTGHCTIESPDALAEAVRALVCDRLLRVLEADPSGVATPHDPAPGRPHLYRALTWILSRATAPLGWVGLGTIVVPHAPSRVPTARRTPVDLTVVTSLAPGSDQIAARAISQCVQRPQQRNRYLEAVLPIPPDAYVARFEREEDREGFRALLTLDRGNGNTHPNPTVIHPKFDGERDPEHPDPPLPLWKAYQDAGRHVVDASELLLAIWDPQHAALPGGTEDVIAYALAKGRIVLWLDPSDLARGALRLRTLVAGETPPAGYQTETLPGRAKDLSRNYHRLAAFNRDPAWDPQAYCRILEHETGRLRDAAAGLPRSVTDMLEQLLLPHFVRADQLALRYHGLRNFVKVLLPTVSALAITFIAFQILFLRHHPELAAVEILLILTAYLSYRLSVHEAWHEKWLNDRHLTERLRALVYTALLPVDDRSRGPQNLLPFYRPTNDWFTSTLARLGGRLRRRVGREFDPAKHVDAVRNFVAAGWLDQQVAHHAAVDAREKTAVHRSKTVTVWTLAGVLTVAAAHAFGVGHHEHHGAAALLSRIDLWIAFLTISIPAWGGAFQVIDSMEDHPRMQERAELMVNSLRGVRARLDEAGTLPDLEKGVTEARRIIELESEDHAGSMRKRAPEVHV